MSLIDKLCAFARLWLRTPFEQAALDAVSAGERLIDAIEAHFATPQGVADKIVLERFAALAAPKMKASEPAPAPDAPLDGSSDYAGAHGRSIYTGPDALPS